MNFLKKIQLGDFNHWENAIIHCSRSSTEASFGDTGSSPDAIGSIGENMLTYRNYPASTFAPYGIIVWFLKDSISIIQINSPVVTMESIMTSVGEAELKLPSGLMSFHTQLAYPSKGLVFHVSDITKETLRIYVFEPCSPTQFTESPLSKVKQYRIKKN